MNDPVVEGRRRRRRRQERGKERWPTSKISISPCRFPRCAKPNMARALLAVPTSTSLPPSF
jgi:hypothetical protein